MTGLPTLICVAISNSSSLTGMIGSIVFGGLRKVFQVCIPLTGHNSAMLGG